MSIREPQKKKATKEAKGMKARPDAMHRAVIFLLDQAKMNNRDITVEANQHIDTLDEELGNPKELAELKKPAKPGPAIVETPATAAPATEETPQDTAGLLRQSSRFTRR